MKKEKTSIKIKNNRLTNISYATSKFQKLPPQAVEIEEVVLGALLLEREALSNVIEILQPENFYKNAHQEIYLGIIELFNDSQPVDIKTITHQLRKSGKLEMVGGAYYVAELTSKVNSSANIEYHARIIVEQSIKRELIRISSEVQQEAYEDTTDVFNLLDRAEQALFEVSESHINKNYDKMSTLLHKAIDEIQQKKSGEGGTSGVLSGFSSLDKLTSGWQPSNLVILAARPGMGKTAFIVSAIRNAAIDHEIPAAIFSLEMSSVELVNRMISAESELEGSKIKRGELADYEWEQVIHKTDKLSKAPIFIDDSPALSILELRAKSRRLVAQHGVKLIVIDYLQLMVGDVNTKNMGGNREQEIANISRSLKSISKELNIPIVALSQLSRAVETRGGDKRPQLSDLRESGAIEQDADMVLFLYRPEYYGFDTDENGMPVSGMAEVIVAKHRNGRTDSVNLKFISKYTKFEDWNINEKNTFEGHQDFSKIKTSDSITLPSKANDENEQETDEENPPF